MGESLFTLGVVTGVHGVKGLLRVRSFAESSDTFKDGLEVVLQSAGKKGERHTILKASPHKKGLLIQFAGVDRNHAEALVGDEILVKRDQLPEPEVDSYFWADLIGLRVKDKTLGVLGTIDSIMETGSNDVFVVKNKTVDPEREFLVPALASVVIKVDIDRGEVAVDLPEGL